MHLAAHGNTAAEVIFRRADASKPNMGLSTWRGPRPRKNDVAVEKNYLHENELKALNLIVSAYLDFAELQALSRRATHMQEWIGKLDDFLRLTEREILTHAGQISHDQALDRAGEEFRKYRDSIANEPTAVDRDFVAAVDELKKISSRAPKSTAPESTGPTIRKASSETKKTRGKKGRIEDPIRPRAVSFSRTMSTALGSPYGVQRPMATRFGATWCNLPSRDRAAVRVNSFETVSCII